MSNVLLRHAKFAATEWKQNGDHPEDGVQVRKDKKDEKEGQVVRRYATPIYRGHLVCPHCGKVMMVHGWLDFPPEGQVVCPGDFVITNHEGQYFAMKPDAFKRMVAGGDTV